MAAGASVLMAGAALGNAFTQSAAAEVKGKYERQQSEFNAHLAELKAKDVVERGDKEAVKFAKEANQFKGKQKAAMAAQGVDIDSASFEGISTQTERLTAFDEMEIRNNAWKEAWGYRVDAANQRTQGEFSYRASQANSRSSLLTGGLQAIGYGAQAYGQYQASRAKPQKS